MSDASFLRRYAFRARKEREIKGQCNKCTQPRLRGSSCCEWHFVWGKSLGVLRRTSTLRVLQLCDLFWAQDARCYLSGRKLVMAQNASIDHVMSVADGGSDDLENLGWTDLEVNRAKGRLSVGDFKALCHEVSL